MNAAANDNGQATVAVWWIAQVWRRGWVDVPVRGETAEAARAYLERVGEKKIGAIVRDH